MSAAPPTLTAVMPVLDGRAHLERSLPALLEAGRGLLSEILVVESELVSEPCDCICCYDLASTFDGLAGGTYELVVSFVQAHPSEPGEWRQTVVIPGTAAGPPQVAAVDASGCGGWAAVESRTWSALKGAYR